MYANMKIIKKIIALKKHLLQFVNRIQEIFPSPQESNSFGFIRYYMVFSKIPFSKE